ncbi:16S rRNA (guanine(527)-N(7))-methyltransferase RsmG [Neomicrococcus aestuarii]|nr:16S rRNA (guanine(527)-N(7))-methyltransferase RsmG [Neomicrococcus aestuarii]
MSSGEETPSALGATEPVLPSESERVSAEKIFGDRFDLAQRFVQHLATSGMERGLLGPREVPRLWGRHVLNCAVIGEHIPQGVTVADVGSGAGLPGLALAIARPDLSLTLIEPLERRCLWLNEVIEDLELDNVVVMRGRAEQMVDFVNADVVTARAVSALTNLIPWSVPLLHGSGEMLAIKGRSAQEEIEKARKVVKKAGGSTPEILIAGADILEEPTTLVRIRVGS